MDSCRVIVLGYLVGRALDALWWSRADFTDWLHAGMGVKSFNTPGEALPAIDDVNSHYERHRQAERKIAEEYFDAHKMLLSLID